jgi:catechol 2,3-dioxygenase-like lactoylglutathione lyase family enzyme
MQVTRILHVAANVNDAPEESIRFYNEVLGLETTPRPEIPGVPGAWFKADQAQVHLVGAMQAPSGINPTGNHICLGVPDIDAAVAELEARGIQTMKATQGPDKVQQVWICDPCGNTIELQEDRELF